MKKTLKKIGAALLSSAVLLTAAACGEEKPKGNIGDVELLEGDVYAVIKVMDYGEITAKLFPEVAPESVKKFTELAERGYYDLKTIHRVIDNYAIQGGSLNGDGTDGEIPDADYVPVETSKYAYHFYGALCFAANSKGSFSQFCIVDNNTPQDINAAITSLSAQLSDDAFASRLLPEDKAYYTEYLEKLEDIPPEVVEKYSSKGGLYQLDGTETVFGQVIDGFDVLEAITACEVVTGNAIDDGKGVPSKPINSVVIETIEIIKIEPAETTEETKKSNKKTTTTTEIVAESIATTTEPEATEETTRKPLDTLVTIE
ncbi:MAG: peptidylprolyl isomerase [Ruminiclostridium sp.]|nr:peptidylprolyl isomerase [Ruminiclostridium sp.]